MSFHSLHRISSFVLNKHFSGAKRKGLLRLIYTEHIKYKIKGGGAVETDRQTDTHAAAVASVLQT